MRKKKDAEKKKILIKASKNQTPKAEMVNPSLHSHGISIRYNDADAQAPVF